MFHDSNFLYDFFACGKVAALDILSLFAMWQIDNYMFIWELFWLLKNYYFLFSEQAEKRKQEDELKQIKQLEEHFERVKVDFWTEFLISFVYWDFKFGSIENPIQP